MDLSLSTKSIIAIFTLIFLSSLIILTKPVSADDPTLVFVDDDFNETTKYWNITHFDNIQNGINAVAENGTIYVYNGSYADEIIVNKSITITGEHVNHVLILGQFYVTNNNTVIEKMTIANVSGGDFPSGIYDESLNSTYRNLRLLNNTHGIQLSYLSNNTMITDNVFEENTFGIYAHETFPHALITNNTIKNNTFGIRIEYSQFYNVFHNTIINNSEVGFSLISSDNNLIYDNYFDNTFNFDLECGINNRWNISKTSGVNIIGGLYLGGNYWSDYTGMDDDGDALGDAGYYFNVEESENDTLPLMFPHFQLFVDDDANLTWYNEIHVRTIQEAINNASIGAVIFVYNGTYNENIQITKTISIFGESIDDVFVSIAEWGDTITVISSGVILKNMTIADNPSGDGAGAAIYDESSNSSYINLNLSNNIYGIYLSSESSGTVITNNLIKNNSVGVFYLSLEYSLIYNNYFENTQNAEILSEEEDIKYWNITKTSGENIIGGPNLGGNYWSDYTGLDEDGDGIGETIYLVDNVTMFIDHLPLTNLTNHPPILGTPEPANGSTNNPLELDWAIQINDSELGVFDWYISCSNGQTSNSLESGNGTKTIHLSNLAYSTSYTISVNVTDYYRWTNKSFTFTTKDKPSDNKKEKKTNPPPVAIITAPDTGYPGETIDFDGSQSYDPNGYILTYSWNLGDETILQGKIVNHSYTTQGHYSVTLTVTDNNGASDTNSKVIAIIKANIPPELSLNLEHTPGELTIKLTVSATDEDGDIVVCNINWGDSSSPTLLQLHNSQQTIPHTYTSYGSYTIFVTGNDGSTETTATTSISIAQEKSKGFDRFGEFIPDFGEFFKFITYNDTFLDNQIHNRSILGTILEPQYVIPFATIISIILLFLFNFLTEFLSDYSSERTIEYRKNKKGKASPKKAKIQHHKFLSKKELIAVIVTTLVLSFVLTLTWAPDLTNFFGAFIIILIIVIIILFLRESLRSYLTYKQKLQSEFYVWPLGVIMMVVSTFIGNTFSLAANHHYDDEGDIKKCGKVSFIVSIVMYLVVLVVFMINLFYHSAILQMIVIVIILNLFIDLFPLNPMDGYEIRHWNIPLWAILYIVVILTYITVYFNLYP